MGRRLRKKVSKAASSRAEALALGEEVLLQALREEDPETRQDAISGLAWIATPGAGNAAIGALKDEDRDVRLSTAMVAAAFGQPAVTPLIATLGDTEEDSIVRGAAAFALGKIGGDRVVKPLMAALGDEQPDVRGAAEDGLRQMGAEHMIKLAAANRQAATESTPGAAPPGSIDASADVDKIVRHESPEAPAKLGDPPQAAGSGGLVDNGDGTVTDMASGLMWQREDDGTERGYELADKYCARLALAGHSNWRLPTKEELAQLAAVDSEALVAAFPGLEHERYWAASPRTELAWAESPERIAYTVDFDPKSANHGKAMTYFRSYSYFARAVRDASATAI